MSAKEDLERVTQIQGSGHQLSPRERLIVEEQKTPQAQAPRRCFRAERRTMNSVSTSLVTRDTSNPQEPLLLWESRWSSEDLTSKELTRL